MSCRMSVSWDLSDVSLMIILSSRKFTEVMDLKAEDHRSEVPFSSHLIKDPYYQHD